MKRTKKTDGRYLVQVEVTETVQPGYDPVYGQQRHEVEHLTHTLFKTVRPYGLSTERVQAEAIASEFSEAMAKRTTRQVWHANEKRWEALQPRTGGATVVSVKPARQHKLKYKWKPARPDKETLDAIDERRAFEYAKWIAKRDGIELPQCGSRCEWSGVYNEHRQRNVRSAGGVSPQATYERRIRAVSWGRSEARYATRKDGRQGAFTHNEWVTELEVELPNWDFIASPPVDESEHRAPSPAIGLDCRT